MISGVESVIDFVAFVLSYSRLMYVGLYREPVDTADFVRMHDEAFRNFGGRPHGLSASSTQWLDEAAIAEKKQALAISSMFDSVKE